MTIQERIGKRITTLRNENKISQQKISLRQTLKGATSHI